MTSKLRTVLVGFGKIGAGYASDPKMAAAFRYSTHAQVLRDHPKYSFAGIIDPRDDLSTQAQNWNIERFAQSPVQFAEKKNIDVLVIATPPENRWEIIDQFPNLKAVILEKPIAPSLQESRQLQENLRARQILSQVNLMRRADVFTRSLMQGGLEEQIGAVQAVFGQYGNGLKNNGTHMIDLLRMLLGEVESVQAINNKNAFVEGPLANDSNLAFNLIFKNGVLVNMQPLRFAHYRENALQFWGTKGLLEYMHGGITIMRSELACNRMLSTDMELKVDSPVSIESTLGSALFEMYSNLECAMSRSESLYSPIDSAIETQKVIEKILDSAQNNCAMTPC